MGGRLQRAQWPRAQAVASWFCLPTGAPEPAATVALARVSSSPLLSGPWGPAIASRGARGPWLIPKASCQPLPWGVCTFSNQLVAPTWLWRGAGALHDGGWLRGGPQAAGKSLGFPTSERSPCPPLVAHGVFHPCLCPGNSRRPGPSCICPLWGLLM